MMQMMTERPWKRLYLALIPRASPYKYRNKPVSGVQSKHTGHATYHAAGSGEEAVSNGIARHSRMRGYAIVWLSLALLALTAQIVNSVVFGNRMRHLTNWAWILNIVGLLAYAVLPRPPALLFTLVWGVVVFVAAGITHIMIQDNTMLSDIEADVGTGMLWAGNIVFHFAPAALWALILWFERGAMHEALQLYHTYDILFFVNAGPLYFLLAYCMWFDPAAEYPGDRLSFRLLFAVGCTTVAAAGIYPVLVASTAPPPRPIQRLHIVQRGAI